MRITFQESKADAEVRVRLRSAGPQPKTLMALFVVGTTAAASVLMVGGYWKAGALFGVVLLLILSLLFKRKQPPETASERSIELNEEYFEHFCTGDVNQGGWTTSLFVDSTDEYLILRRDRIALFAAPKRVLADADAQDFEVMLRRLVGSATSEEPRQAVPLWNAAQRQRFDKTVRYVPSPDDFATDSLQKYEPAAERPRKTAGRGCALFLLAGTLVLMVFSTDGWDNDVSMGAVALILLILLIGAANFWQRQATKRMVRQSPSFFGHEQMCGLDHRGASLGSPRGFTFIPWANFQGVMFAENRLVGLLHNAGLLYIVPRHAFANDQEAEDFMAFAHERIVEAGEPVVEAELVEPRPETGNPYQSPNV